MSVKLKVAVRSPVAEGAKVTPKEQEAPATRLAGHALAVTRAKSPGAGLVPPDVMEKLRLSGALPVLVTVTVSAGPAVGVVVTPSLPKSASTPL
jgi:hypothetical protein